MAAAMMGIPGATIVELRSTDESLDLLIETAGGDVRCPSCGGVVEAAGSVLEALPTSSVGGRVARTTWRRRQWRCGSFDCGLGTFAEHDDAVDEFCERVSSPSGPAPLLPSPRRNRSQQ
jgi:hypothetical protein